MPTILPRSQPTRVFKEIALLMVMNHDAHAPRQNKGSARRAALLVLAAMVAVATSGSSANSATSKAETRRATEQRTSAPKPQQVQTRSKPLGEARTKLEPFQTAPFPYRGTLPGSSTPFLDVERDGRRGHTTPYGRLYWEDETYSDNRVLLHIPKGFDVRRPALILVFFHGHGATLERDVLARQRVANQVSRSGVNAVLVAPQLAYDASDSSAGKFWQPGAFGRFMGEAAEKLAALHGDKRSIRTFASAPVVVVAYSGGYLAAAWSAKEGGLEKRIRGIVLLDALYGELGKFTSWIEKDPTAFFVSAYLGSTKEKNERLEGILNEREIGFDTNLAPKINQGDVKILPGGPETTSHRSFVTRAWVDNPIEDILRRLPGYRK